MKDDEHHYLTAIVFLRQKTSRKTRKFAYGLSNVRSKNPLGVTARLRALWTYNKNIVESPKNAYSLSPRSFSIAKIIRIFVKNKFFNEKLLTRLLTILSKLTLHSKYNKSVDREQ